MGTWGPGPFDNDAAGDLAASFQKRIERALRAKTYPDYYYAEGRFATQVLLLTHATDILGGPDLRPSIELLAKMRKDTGWLAGWRDPQTIADRLDKEMRTLLARTIRCRWCRRSHGRSGLQALRDAVREARQAPVPDSEWPSRKFRRRRTTRVRVVGRTKRVPR